MALSANDTRVLSALFDPESSPSSAIHIDRSASTLPGLSEETCLTLKSQLSSILQSLDTASPTPSQLSSTHEALSNFISENPGYAPAYVDRAQLTRLTLSTSDLFTETHERSSRSLLSDLAEAIKLATPVSPADPVSGLQSRILAAAHTHRGLLLLKVADMRLKDTPVYGAGDEVARSTHDEVEALASRDFAAGGRYGNDVAKGLAVKTNPYAKMCGAIVKEAIQKEIDEAERGLRGELTAET